jgi:hypothetical protein
VVHRLIDSFALKFRTGAADNKVIQHLGKKKNLLALNFPHYSLPVVNAAEHESTGATHGSTMGTRSAIFPKKRLLPFGEHGFLFANETVLHDMNLAGIRDAAEQDIRPDPAPRALRLTPAVFALR